MSGDKRRRRINRTLLAKLSIALPIASEVPIRKLLRLRDREREAFVRFRVALNQMANEVGPQDEESLERRASQIYEDMLRPKLAELDQRVKAAKRDLIRAPLATAGGVVGVLCFGVFAGLLSAEMTEVVRALGLSKIVYDVGAKSVDLMDVRKNIRQDELYYLWEVKRLRQ